MKTIQSVGKPGIRTALLGTAAIFCTLTLPCVSYAQQASAPVREPAGQLGEVVVTAQRREESVQKAAVAIAVVSNADLQNAGVTKASDLQNLVPSLQITSNGGSNSSFFLRGVGTFSNNSYSDPAVAFNYDGVYIGRPAASSGIFYDLERVEVLKGPQGTLYGRNATGGAINVIPVRPKLGQNSGFVAASYGNYNAVNLQGALNLRASDNAAVRLSGTYINRDGYLSDGTSDDKGYALRGQFLVEISPDVRARVGADYYHQGGLGGGANFSHRILYDAPRQAYAIQPSGLGPSVGLLDPRSDLFHINTFAGLSGSFQIPLQRRPYLDNNSYGVNADLEWRSELGTLTITPAYRRFEQDGIQDALAVLIETHETDEQVSLEGRFASNAEGPLTWLAGGYYYSETVNSDFRVQQQVLDSFQNYRQKTNSAAAFGRVSYEVADGFRIVAGGRYTRDRKTFGGVANVLQDVCTYTGGGPCIGAPVLSYGSSVQAIIQQMGLINVAPGAYVSPVPAARNSIYLSGAVPIDGRRTDGKVTYRAGVEWDVASASLLYASYETGFRSGGFAFSSAKPTFGPEKIRAFTLGSKNRFLENRLQLNAELFYWRYEAQQVSHLGQDPGVGLAYFTENVGRSTNRGFEVEVAIVPAASTKLTADLQYLDAVYNDFTYTQPTMAGGAPTPYPLVGCPVSRPAAITPTSNYSIDCSGQRGQQSPKWTFKLGAEKRVDLSGYDAMFEVGTRYQSDTVTGFEFIQPQFQKGYWTSQAAVTVAPVSDRWSATAFINNIENNRPATYSFLSSITSVVSQVTAAPRTYGIRLTAKF